MTPISDDMVERLRAIAKFRPEQRSIFREAASEIERLRTKLAALEGSVAVPAVRYQSAFDGFVGTKIGAYKRLDGYEGLVLQQDGTKVVHVYGVKHLTPAAALPRHKCGGEAQ